MPTQRPEFSCLQCGKSRQEVRDPNDAACATEQGYEVRETLHEWERHHWRDWSDKELAAYDILPEYYDQHRRDDIYDLPYSPCEHTSTGHTIPSKDIYIGKYIMHVAGVCIHCGKKGN